MIQLTFIHFDITEKNSSMNSKDTKGSGWQHIRTADGETYAIIFDIYIIYEEDFVNKYH